MNIQQLVEEENILAEFLKWSGGPEDNQQNKHKSKTQAYIVSAMLFVTAIVLFFLEIPSVLQLIGLGCLIIALVYFFMAQVISGSSYNLKYTQKYIDTGAIRERLLEIQRMKLELEKRSSGWS